jgi:hypothetical protein
MEPDITARAIAIAALVLALASIVVTVVLWQFSGPRMKVSLRREERPTDRLVIRISNTGRMAIRVTEIGLEDRVSTGQPSATMSYISMPVEATDGKPTSRVLEHTDLPILCQVPMNQIVARWFAGKKLTLVAWAKDGNDHKKSSQQLSFKTPPT